MSRIVHWNGKLVPEEEARVSPFDRGLLLGDGVFETMRAYAGRPFAMEEHLARLERSCRLTRLPLPTGLPEALRDVLRANGLDDAALRITITRGPGGAGASPTGAGPPTVLVTAMPVPARPELWERGLRLATATRRRRSEGSLDPGIKSTNYLVNVLARIEAEEHGADDALFVDEDGFVIESTQANVFALAGARLVTPPLASGCLPGVTRQRLLALAPALGLRAEEAPLTCDDVLAADEAFLTASVTEIAPIVALDGKTIGSGRPGEGARRIHRAYRERAMGGAGRA